MTERVLCEEKMFDKRLMILCPESKKYIFGNILLQFFELCLNVGMIVTIALTVQKLYDHAWTAENLPLPMLVILCTVVLRFFTTRYAVRMSYLASRTVKRVMREKIYGKLLRLGTSYREHVTTAELVQEAVEGVDQLESYFGQYVPQFFYAFMAPIALFFLFGFGGSWKVAAVLLICSILSEQQLAEYHSIATSLGLSVLVAFKPLIASVSTAAVIWIIAEGVCYITGAVFYSLNKQKYMHTVFHFFVLAGSVCHIIAVWDVLMQYL